MNVVKQPSQGCYIVHK